MSTHQLTMRACSLTGGRCAFGGPTRRMLAPSVRRTITRAQQSDGDSGSDSTESLFMKELKKRGINSTADAGAAPSGEAGPSTSGGAPPRPPPGWAQGSNAPPPDQSQLDRSRALNSEGLEGLIPRASQLLALGGSFFLAFGPLILAASVLFTAVYLVLGDAFIHGGTPSSAPPPYLDPYDLLSEPTVERMIPLEPLSYPSQYP